MTRSISRRGLLRQFALLGTAAGATWLSACGGITAAPTAAPAKAESKSAATTAPAKTQAQATSAPAAKGGAMRYLYNATPGPNEKVHLDLITLFEKQNPGATVEKIRVPTDAEIVQKLLAMLAANDLPDLFWNRQRTAPPFIERDVLLDLAPLAATDKVDTNDFWPSALKTYGRGKALYGLPNSASSNAYYFNADMYREAGLPLPTETAKKGPWNWETLVDQSIKLTKGEGPTKQFGFDRPTSIYQIDMYIWQNGGRLWNEDKTESYLNSPEATGAIQWLVDFVQKHKSMPSSVETQSGGNLFAAGRVAIQMAGRYILQSIDKSKFKPGMAIAPAGPKANTTRGDDLASSILKEAPNRDRAWEFAKMWSSDDGQKIVLESRRSYTARRSFAKNEWMKQNLLPWEDQETYILGLERTGAYRAPAHTGEVNKIFNREMDLAYLGEKSVKDATDTMKREIDVVLKKKL